MPGIANYSAWIEVDGKELPEYNVKYSKNGARATCWIPSEAGKEFFIVYKDRLRATGTGTRVRIDGVSCGGKGLHKSDKSPIVYHKGMSTSAQTYRPYVFSNCKLTDDDDTLGLVPGIGEIKLRVDEIQINGVIPWSKKPAVLPPLNIHERSKKGIVHGTQLGQEVFHNPIRQRSTKKVGRLVLFVFKYRPKAVLMADGIAPREESTPSKRKALAEPEDIIDLTLDDEVHHTRKKRRRADETSDAAVKTEIKQESSTTLDNEVIDFT